MSQSGKEPRGEGPKAAAPGAWETGGSALSQALGSGSWRLAGASARQLMGVPGRPLLRLQVCFLGPQFTGNGEELGGMKEASKDGPSRTPPGESPKPRPGQESTDALGGVAQSCRGRKAPPHPPDSILMSLQSCLHVTVLSSAELGQPRSGLQGLGEGQACLLHRVREQRP